MADILVIGYGNELRGDDGIGPRLAQDIAAANCPGVQVRSVCQLVPELAAEVAVARMVVFVDAAVCSDRITVELKRVEAHEAADWSTHIADPRTLIALAGAVYGRTPEAWWLTVPGQHFAFGESLSSIARTNVKKAREQFQRLIADPPTDTPLVAPNREPRSRKSEKTDGAVHDPCSSAIGPPYRVPGGRRRYLP